MKAKIRPSLRATWHSFGGAVCAGAVLLITFNLQAQNLFVSHALGSTTIPEITPGGAQSTFVSGLYFPWGLAFQPVPEPSALLLLAPGATALLVRRRLRLSPDRIF